MVEIFFVRVVLSDLNMPEMDGIEFSHLLSQRHPALPIILMSGYPLGFAAVEIPHVSQLAKPIRLGTLVTAIESVLHKGKG